MALRGRAAHKNHNPTLYLLIYLPITIYFSYWMPVWGHILESTKGIEIKLAPYIDVKDKYSRQEPLSYLTFYLSLFWVVLRDNVVCSGLCYVSI